MDCAASGWRPEHPSDRSRTRRVHLDWCGRIRAERIRSDHSPSETDGLREQDEACRLAPSCEPAGVRPRRNGRRSQTQYRFQACRPDQPASAILTTQRRRLHSCHDYTAGKSGPALTDPAWCDEADFSTASINAGFEGLKRTSVLIQTMSVF